MLKIDAPAIDLKMNLVTRLMTKADLEAVVEIERLCGLSVWGCDGYEEELNNPDASLRVCLVHVAREANSFDFDKDASHQLAAFITARLIADECHITNIGVHPFWRRKGIGNLLLREAMKAGVEQAAKWMVLEVRASNEAAIKMYERENFEIVGTRKNYYRQPTEDALMMAREL